MQLVAVEPEQNVQDWFIRGTVMNSFKTISCTHLQVSVALTRGHLSAGVHQTEALHQAPRLHPREGGAGLCGL